MKKILLCFASLAIPFFALAEVKTIPYSSALYQDTEWTVVDNNSDGSTWKDNDDFNSIVYSYNSSNAADDWYVSPSVHLEAGKTYKLSIDFRTSSSYLSEKFQIFVASASDVETLKSGASVINVSQAKSYGAWSTKMSSLTVEADGDYYFGLECCSAADKANLYLTNFVLDEYVLTPAAPTNLQAVPTDDTVSLSWDLPTQDNLGNDLTASLSAIEVYRDSNLVATLDGKATSWTDSSSAGLETGKTHTYSVVAVIGSQKSAESETASAYVKGGPATLPWTSDLSDESVFSGLWTTSLGSSDTNGRNWEYDSNEYLGNRVKLYASYRKVSDAWLIGPAISFDKAGIYKMTVEAQTYNGSFKNMEFWLGSGVNVSDFTQKIGDEAALTNSKASYSYYFQVSTPGVYYVSAHEFQDSSSSWSSETFYIYSMAVEEATTTPAQVDDLTVAIDDNKINLAWTNPSKDSKGFDLSELTKVEVYRDDVLMETLTSVAPGVSATWTDNSPKNGINTYYVIACNAYGAAEGDPMKVASESFGSDLTVPYEYDFSTDTSFSSYTVVDANNDGLTWTYSDNSAKLTLPSSMASYNDYFITPAFALEKGTYTVTYKVKGYYGDSHGVTNGMLTSTSDLSFVDSKKYVLKYADKSNYATVVNEFTIAEDGKYYFAWFDNAELFSSDPATQISYISIVKKMEKAGLATDLKVTPDADKALKATLEWKNPTGVALTKAVVLRDGTEIATVTEGLVAGEISSYVDDTLTSAGIYTYSVEVYGADGKSDDQAPTVTSAWIGAGLYVPYSANFYNWTCSSDQSTVKWEVYTYNTTGDRAYFNTSVTSPDAWIVSEPIEFEAKHVYDFEFNAYMNLMSDSYDLTMTSGSSLDTSTQAELNTTTVTAQRSSSPQAVVITLRAVDENDTLGADGFDGTIPAGTRYVAFHGNKAGTVNVRDFTIKENSKSSVRKITASNSYIYQNGKLLFDDMAFNIVVADLSGKTVVSLSSAKDVDASGLTSGVYVFNAVVNGNRVVGKFIK